MPAYTPHRPPRRKLSEKELHQLEGYGLLRVPMAQIASLFGISESTLMRILKKQPEAAAALESAQAKSSLRVRRTLYERAVGAPPRQLPDEVGPRGEKIPGKWLPAIEPEPWALKFWAQTQEGFMPTERHELTGAGGGPIENRDETREALIERVTKLRKANDLTTEE